MIRGVYSLCMAAAQPLLRRKLARRGAAEPGYLEAMEERFGRYASTTAPGRLWIHAVSLGETRAAAILIDALRAAKPALRVLLTHGTATGRAAGAQLLREGDAQAWLPWDTPGGVRRFLEQFRPCAGVLMETEVWPNLAAACAQRGLPVALVNARLSEKSLARSKRLAFLSRPAYASLTAVWAQTAGDALRLEQAGARVSGVMGNLKFDALPDPALVAQGRQWRERAGAHVVMFASSREGEEADFLRALNAARAQPASRGVRWLLVPRHPQRFEEVASMAALAGVEVSRRSEWADGPPAGDQLWIGDSLGEMPLYYGLAEVALLGGSFAPLGGQNLIEAAACGCPVVMGPHTFNFAEAAEMALAAGAALREPSIDAALRQAIALVSEPPRREELAQAASRFAQAHRGAASRCSQAVLALIEA